MIPSSIDVSITRNRSCDSNTTSSVSSTQEKYFFCTVSSPLDYLIRWKKYPDVSAASSELQIPVGHFEPYALYIFPVAIFLELVMKSSDGVDFPDLASYLEEKLFSWRNDANDAECAKVSFIIALVDLNNAALKVQQEVSCASLEVDLWSADCRLTESMCGPFCSHLIDFLDSDTISYDCNCSLSSKLLYRHRFLNLDLYVMCNINANSNRGMANTSTCSATSTAQSRSCCTSSTWRCFAAVKPSSCVSSWHLLPA